MKIQKVGIVGGGEMGGGIAALILRESDCSVVIMETAERIEVAQKRLRDQFEKWCMLGHITPPQVEALMARATFTSKRGDFADVDFFIEAINEDPHEKQKVFAFFDLILRKDVIMATNTSSLSVTQIASRGTERPNLVLGCHFFNPPTSMKLVELVQGEKTSDETIEIVKNFVRSLGKVTITVKDSPLFVVNRLLFFAVRELLLGLEKYVVTIEEMDAIALEYGWPMGLFALSDRIGLDVVLSVAQVAEKTWNDTASVGTILPKLVEMKRLGKKTGSGFYSADPEETQFGEMLEEWYPNRSDFVSAKIIFNHAMSMMYREADIMVKEGIVTAHDVNTGARWGLGFPKDVIHIDDDL